MSIDQPTPGPGTAPASAAAPWQKFLALPLIVLALAAGVAFICYSASSLLLLFAGMLFAVLLDAFTAGLGRVLPLSRAWRFTIVIFVLASLAALVMIGGVVRAPGQIHMLIDLMDSQLVVLEKALAGFGIDLFGPNGREDLGQFFSDPGRLFGHVHTAVSGAYVVVMNTIVVVCLGMFFGAQPAAYREGALLLLPVAARPRVRAVMNEMGMMLRSWLLGQLVRSAVVAVALTIAFQWLGLPGAPLLALQAGIANFIPYLGPLLAVFPVILVAMPLGLPVVAWVIVIYFSIQTLEGFVIAPLIQKGSVNLAPAWTLFAIVVFGALFGAMGVALAAPLLAIARIATLRFYVEDWLEARAGTRVEGR